MLETCTVGVELLGLRSTFDASRSRTCRTLWGLGGWSEICVPSLLCPKPQLREVAMVLIPYWGDRIRLNWTLKASVDFLRRSIRGLMWSRWKWSESVNIVRQETPWVTQFCKMNWLEENWGDFGGMNSSWHLCSKAPEHKLIFHTLHAYYINQKLWFFGEDWDRQ